MGIFDFFRSRKHVENILEIKEVEIKEVRNQVLIRINFSEKGFEKVVEEINSKKKNFIDNLRQRIILLESIDLIEKREKERIKLINLQNLKDYIRALSRLVISLEKIDGKKHEYLFELDLSIGNFLKNSRRNLAIAKILIGDELADTEELIKKFHKEVIGKIEENKLSILEYRKLAEAKNLTKEIVDVDEFINSLEKSILSLESKLDEERGVLEEIKKSLNSFRISSKFLEWKDKRDEFFWDKSLVLKKIQEIKSSIDLKEILKKFHGAKNTESLIESYRSDFVTALKKDESLEISTLFEKDLREEFNEKLKDLRKEILRLDKNQVNFEKNIEEEKLLEKINFSLSHIEKFEEEINLEKKKMEKLLEKKKLLVEDFNLRVKELKDFNFKLICSN